jgi:P-type E1-E2 ATPase
MQLRPDEALVRRGQTEVRIRVERLRAGDRVIVKPGERIPIDGSIAAGESAVDQSTITGESMQVDVSGGSQVYAGRLNTIVGVPLPLGVAGHGGSTLLVVVNGLRLLRGASI